MEKNKQFLSVIIPGYNEEKRIIPTLTKLYEFLDTGFEKFELFFVSDGSTDKTVDLVADLISTKDPEKMKLHKILKNQGKGNAVREAVALANGDFIFFTDSDLPYSLDEFMTALDRFNHIPADVVVGARDLKESKVNIPYSPLRKMLSFLSSTIISIILPIGIKDTQCGFKGFRKKVAKAIFPRITILGFGFDVEVLFMARKYNLKVEKIPVTLTHSTGSKVRVVKDSLRVFKELFLIRGNNKRGHYDGLDL